METFHIHSKQAMDDYIFWDQAVYSSLQILAEFKMLKNIRKFVKSICILRKSNFSQNI